MNQMPILQSQLIYLNRRALLGQEVGPVDQPKRIYFLSYCPQSVGLLNEISYLDLKQCRQEGGIVMQDHSLWKFSFYNRNTVQHCWR